VKEIENTRKENDKELLEKNKQISDLKYQTERMQKYKCLTFKIIKIL